MTVLAGALLALLPLPRAQRYRLRLRWPTAARRADALAEAAPAVLATLAVAAAALAAIPWPPTGLRVALLVIALALGAGIPIAVERRRLRHRLDQAPAAADPLERVDPAEHPGHEEAATALADGDAEAALLSLGPLNRATADRDELRLRALAHASLGEAVAARSCALRALQLDTPEGDTRQALHARLLCDTGLLLARRGRFADGIRLLKRGRELAPSSVLARLALADGLAAAGRLRDAVAILDEEDGPAAAGLRSRRR